jgi:hypothetical protein
MISGESRLYFLSELKGNRDESHPKSWFLLYPFRTYQATYGHRRRIPPHPTLWSIRDLHLLPNPTYLSQPPPSQIRVRPFKRSPSDLGSSRSSHPRQQSPIREHHPRALPRPFKTLRNGRCGRRPPRWGSGGLGGGIQGTACEREPLYVEVLEGCRERGVAGNSGEEEFLQG